MCFYLSGGCCPGGILSWYANGRGICLHLHIGGWEEWDMCVCVGGGRVQAGQGLGMWTLSVILNLYILVWIPDSCLTHYCRETLKGVHR